MFTLDRIVPWGRSFAEYCRMFALSDADFAGRIPSLPFPDALFDLALCSHLLFLYSRQLDGMFHRAAIRELCRVACEVRVFPLLALDGLPSAHVAACVEQLRGEGHDVAIETVRYEFQRGGNQMLRIRRSSPRRG
jgi:hypothetical protein